MSILRHRLRHAFPVATIQSSQNIIVAQVWLGLRWMPIGKGLCKQTKALLFVPATGNASGGAPTRKAAEQVSATLLCDEILF